MAKETQLITVTLELTKEDMDFLEASKDMFGSVERAIVVAIEACRYRLRTKTFKDEVAEVLQSVVEPLTAKISEQVLRSCMRPLPTELPKKISPEPWPEITEHMP